MAVSTKWIYPPNWDGDVTQPPQRWCVQLMSVSAGTDETNVRKVVLADLITRENTVPTKFVIEKIEHNCMGFAGITLEFDRETDSVFFYAPGDGTGSIDYRREGGLVDDEVGDTGDILLSTTGATANDSYNIKITFRVK